jgi:hypothetical protein
MMKRTEFALVAAIMAIGLSSPALAQSFDSDFGAGDVLPNGYLPNGYGVNSDENGVQWQSRPQFDSPQPHGHALYDTVPSKSVGSRSQFDSRKGRR